MFPETTSLSLPLECLNVLSHNFNKSAWPHFFLEQGREAEHLLSHLRLKRRYFFLAFAQTSCILFCCRFWVLFGFGFGFGFLTLSPVLTSLRYKPPSKEFKFGHRPLILNTEPIWSRHMTCRSLSETNKECVEEFHLPVAEKVNYLFDLWQVKIFLLTWQAESTKSENWKLYTTLTSSSVCVSKTNHYKCKCEHSLRNS